MPTTPLTTPPQPEIVSLEDYKLLIGETNDDNDELHQMALDAAAWAVANYTDRDFGSSAVTEDRTYIYDGEGILEIDDASAVNAVTYSGALLDERAWYARLDGPTAAAVYTYLELPPIRRESGEMGFTFNLDKFLRRNPAPVIEVTVNAVWGWEEVPADVQRATVWIARSFENAVETGGAGNLTSKSKTVAEVSESESYAVDVGEGAALAEEGLPDKAAALLTPYRRHTL